MDRPEKYNDSHKTFQLSIAVFKGLCFLIAFIIFAIIGVKELQSIFKIKNNSEKIARTQLPAFVENQKTLVNIERLRYIAEVIRSSDNPKERRNKRISAEAFASESIFEQDPNFKKLAKTIVVAMKDLVEAKSEVDKINQNILELQTNYSNTLITLANITTATENNLGIIKLINEKNYVFSSNHNDLKDLEDQIKTTLQTVNYYTKKISINHPDKLLFINSQVEAINSIFEHSLLIKKDRLEANKKINTIWQEIDNNLKIMSDSVTAGAEVSLANSMLSITTASNNAFQSSIGLYFLIFISFTIYYILEYVFIVKPLRLTSEKLAAIQDGKLDTKLPKIYIKELANIANLLDRFSTHLSELYSHANQLEEDVNKKRNFEAIMRAVFKVSLDGYIVWNENTILSVSEGTVKLFELETEQNFINYWESKDFLQNKANIIFKNIQNETVWRENVDFYTPNHKQLPCELTHLIVEFDNQQCILSYIRDLREQKKNELALLKAKDAAEVATKAKSDFLARMSHEIRTPMNGVLGLTKLALEESPSPRQKTLLEKIESSANILLGVINDILDFSKIEQGALTLEVRPFTLNEVVVPVFDLIEHLAFQKNIKLNKNIDQDLLSNIKFMGDNLRLSQILLNLCGNAIKFTEKGNVTVSVTCIESNSETMTLNFSVKDTGIGMTLEQQQSLFKPFAQADSSTTRKYGGTGLGLMIAKLLIEQMHGSIHIKSEPEKGSEFYFVIPFKLAQNSKENILIEQEREENNKNLVGKHILVVEDNEINQEIIVSFLENFDINVTTANNGQEALDILKTHDFDCIFMDIQMPIMDGLTAAKEIRKNGRNEIKNIPIIAMTAHVLQADIDKSINAGMNNHLTKPIEYEKLVKQLHDIFI
ncbi:response regulator [Desulfovibrio litoralis]|uniref:Sensory/regulatory protein RpfC n=1 Tax=Desulfovibrio litoralis DSM 11393 TaxID=1121455 RepID=A0A1M7SKW4_9BACT|nr:response regulator [Desulfovibrio litoralis]SHN59075.1 His Kinase A (phospho-acceptor) domain-containing protein [Desulfovibrio litoralis DSM 11393]